MQIVITLNSEEELKTFLANMAQGTQAPQPAAARALDRLVHSHGSGLLNPTATPASVTAESAPAVPKSAPAAAPAPAPVKKVTYQDLQAKAIALMDQGKQEQLKALLQRYNVPALPSLTEEQYWSFMADMEAM